MMESHRPPPPPVIRGRLVPEVAAEVLGAGGWPYRDVRVSLSGSGADGGTLVFSGGADLTAIDDVARGQVQVSIINPAAVLTVALRGRGPYERPVPLRAIAVMPSPDQIGLAVTGDSGLRSLADIKEQRFPLKVSLRGNRSPTTHLFINELLSAAGFSLDDIQAWGGEVRYDQGMPEAPTRIGAVERGEIDAIFDEAVPDWGERALALGMRFLPLEEPLLQQMEDIGFRRALLTKAAYPKLPEDVPTLDFSGWTVFTRDDAPDEVVTAVCGALEARRDRLMVESGEPLPLEQMVRDSPDGPLDIPLHPAAERYWRQLGYLA